jgi:hypothetical protein
MKQFLWRAVWWTVMVTAAVFAVLYIAWGVVAAFTWAFR